VAAVNRNDKQTIDRNLIPDEFIVEPATVATPVLNCRCLAQYTNISLGGAPFCSPPRRQSTPTNAIRLVDMDKSAAAAGSCTSTSGAAEENEEAEEEADAQLFKVTSESIVRVNFVLQDDDGLRVCEQTT
jgi:hypothetical protein